MKEIVPIKIICNLNADGTLNNGVIQYQIKTDGVLDRKFRTIGIQDGMTEEASAAIGTVTQKAIDLAKQAEGIE